MKVLLIGILLLLGPVLAQEFPPLLSDPHLVVVEPTPEPAPACQPVPDA